MSILTVTSREFNQDVSKVKRDALKGPVFITDRGQVAHVLLSIDSYNRLSDKEESIVELLTMPDVGGVDFESPQLSGDMYRPADLS